MFQESGVIPGLHCTGKIKRAQFEHHSLTCHGPLITPLFYRLPSVLYSLSKSLLDDLVQLEALRGDAERGLRERKLEQEHGEKSRQTPTSKVDEDPESTP